MLREMQQALCFAKLPCLRLNRILICLICLLLQLVCFQRAGPAPIRDRGTSDSTIQPAFLLARGIRSTAQAAQISHPGKKRGALPTRLSQSSDSGSGATEDSDQLEAARREVEDGTRLFTDSKESSLRQAIEKYQLAREYFVTAHRRGDEAIVLVKLGEVFSVLGEQEKALEQFDLALRLSRSNKDTQQEVEVLNKRGEVYALVGQNTRAISIFREALRLARRLSNTREFARATANLGVAHYNLSDMNRAQDFLMQALKLWDVTEDPGGRAQTLKYLGYLYVDMSELPTALDYFQQSLELCRTIRDLRSQAQTVNAIALIHSLLGEREKAIENYAVAEHIFRDIGYRQGIVTALNGEGEVYLDLDINQALGCHTEALRLSNETGDLIGQVISHRYLGKAERALGDARQATGHDDEARKHYESAIEHYQQALSLARTLKDRRIEAYSLQDIGDVSDSAGDVNSALSYYQRALQLSREVKDPRGQALILNSLGTTYLKVNQEQPALLCFQRALPLTRAAQDHGHESLTLYNIANVQRAQSDLAAASANIDKAIQIIEELRSRVPGHSFRSSYFASVHQYYELRIDLQMQKHKQNPEAGFQIKALEDSELARARGLLDMLSDSRSAFRTAAAPELLDEERKLRQTLNVKAEYQMKLLSGEHSAEQATAAETQIRQLTIRYENVQEQIRKQNPHYAALTQPRPLSVNEIQQRLLDNNSLLLEYALGDNRSYLWVVSKAEIESYELPGRAEIEALVRSFYNLLTASQSVIEETADQRQLRIDQAYAQLPFQAARLGRVVLGPAAAKLANKRLLIVSDGALQYVPFQALIVSEIDERHGISAESVEDPQSDGPSPLIFRHEIVNEPSAAALALLLDEAKGRQSPSRNVAVLADPVFEIDDPRIESGGPSQAQGVNRSESGELRRALRDVGLPNGWSKIPRLPGSRAEADAILAAVPWGTGMKAIGFEASRVTAISPELGKYRIVHFATHGFILEQHPELSGVVLSLFDRKGQPVDGFLRLFDIYNLNLPVDLVVLSACNTGLGKDVRGEGLVGLTRGFMYAGASGVIASLWKVDDEATADLMQHFYEGMFTEKLSAPAALRKAQLELSRQKRWRSPYYWAGFVIQGQYAGRENSEGKTITWRGKLVSLAILTIVLVTGLYSIKHYRRKLRN